jgi:hypothetical protein
MNILQIPKIACDFSLRIEYIIYDCIADIMNPIEITQTTISIITTIIP